MTNSTQTEKSPFITLDARGDMRPVKDIVRSVRSYCRGLNGIRPKLFFDRTTVGVWTPSGVIDVTNVGSVLFFAKRRLTQHIGSALQASPVPEAEQIGPPPGPIRRNTAAATYAAGKGMNESFMNPMG